MNEVAPIRPNVDELILDAGFHYLSEDSNFSTLQGVLLDLAKSTRDLDAVSIETVRAAAIQKLVDLKISSPERLVDTVLLKKEAGGVVQLSMVASERVHWLWQPYFPLQRSVSSTVTRALERRGCHTRSLQPSHEATACRE